MAKADVVSVQKQAVLDGQGAALEAGLGACYDAGLADAPPSGGLTQADLDAAVAAAREEDAKVLADQKALDDAALADEHQRGAEALAALQVQLDAVSAAKAVEDGVIQGLQSSKDQIQAALDTLKSLILG